MNSKYEKLPFLPETHLDPVCQGITLLRPLSRRGEGPGLIVLVPNTGVTGPSTLAIEEGIPCPLMKWGEEGYTTVEVTESAFETKSDPIKEAIASFAKHECANPKNVVGLIAYTPELWNRVAPLLKDYPQIVGATIFGDLSDSAELEEAAGRSGIPCALHLAGKTTGLLTRNKKLTVYDYPTANSHLFASPFHKDFHYTSEAVSHTRTLAFLKPLMGGPYFDLEAIWDEHTYYEFENRSVECTMNTMVQEPYNPDDTEQEVISRSIGIDRIANLLRTRLPGIPPTGRKIEVPLTAVVNIRGDRLYHEHIAWDQATVLIQLGLLPEYLPFSYQLPNGPTPSPGRTIACRLPAGGTMVAAKLRDRYAHKSNTMMEYKVKEV
ncbi:dienelactone hydrolase s [Ilyonectria robusta]